MKFAMWTFLIFTILQFLGTLSNMSRIGKERKPITSGEVSLCWVVLIFIGISTFILWQHFYGQT